MSWPVPVFAPYLDVLLWPTLRSSFIDSSASKVAEVTGAKFFTLAFIVADKHGNPSWGAQTPISNNPGSWYMKELDNLRNLGGDAAVSFGGALNVELALHPQNSEPETLLSKYQSVIDLYKLRSIDFDIEGSAMEDYKSIKLRNKCICELKKRNPSLHVSYTLPVTPSGLSDSGVKVLKNAMELKASVDLVNIMAMNYGPSNAPKGTKEMGNYAISAAKSAKAQLTAIGMENVQIGITAMVLGYLNDFRLAKMI